MARPRKKGNGLPKGVYWQNGAWRYKAKNQHERDTLGKLWVRLGTTADDVYKNYWPMIGSKVGDSAGMDKLWEIYKSEVLPHKAPRTQKDDAAMWKIMQPMFEGCNPGSITRTWGIEYLKARGIKGIPPYKPAPSRAAKEYALLRHMLTVALDKGIISTNPLLGVDVNNYVKNKVRDRTPEVWELIAVKKIAPIEISLFIDFKYMTGLDQSTCFKLPIPHFESPGIPVKRSKTHKRGYIEWTDELVDVCRALIAFNNNRCPNLFCNTIGNPWQVDSFSQRFRKIIQKAIKLGLITETFTPNDIRSSHGTDAEELYGLDATKQLLNSEGARKHYVHKRKGEKITPLPAPRPTKNSI